ncbi:MAG: protein kinase, partial [Planctomycetota bacterium]|nr:protein kinase [Planctomycetota bacterium]
MAIEFTCPTPHCGKKLSTPNDQAGAKLRCPKCEETFHAPHRSGEPARAVAADETGGREETPAIDRLEPFLEMRGKGRDALQDERAIAEGGMGKVLLCTDKSLERSIAMKIMQSGIADSEEHRLRFLAEAQITGQLEHPSIVPVHELGKDEEGSLYFTMKHVRGRSLGQILAEQRSEVRGQKADGRGQESGEMRTNKESTHQPHNTLSELLGIFQKTCDAIAFAHSKGVIHRDLKPDNIMVGDFGEVLVMDWGIAKVLSDLPSSAEDQPAQTGRPTREAETVMAGRQRPDDDGGVERPQDESPNSLSDIQSVATVPASSEAAHSIRANTDIAATMEGKIQGTPAYMPPEQAEGKVDQIDHRSDIYSLGAILYEMLTLERPFKGKSPYEVLLKVTEGRVTDPSQLAPGRAIPRELSAIAMKAMARSRRSRYQSVGELQKDISLFLEGRAVSAKEDSPLETLGKLIKRNRGVSSSIGIAAVLILCLGALAYHRVSQQRDLAVEEKRKAQKALAGKLAAEREKAKTQYEASRSMAEQAIRSAENGFYREASIRAEAAEKLSLDAPWGAYAHAYIDFLENDLKAAEGHLNRALEREPDHSPSKALLARLKTLRGEAEEAARLIEDPEKLTDWRTASATGETLYQARRFEEAQVAFGRAAALMKNAQDAAPADQKRVARRLQQTCVAGERCRITGDEHE